MISSVCKVLKENGITPKFFKKNSDDSRRCSANERDSAGTIQNHKNSLRKKS